MFKINLILAVLMFPVSVLAFSAPNCNEEQITQYYYNKYSSIETSTSMAALIGLAPLAFGKFGDLKDEDPAITYYSIGSLASLFYVGLYKASWIGCRLPQDVDNQIRPNRERLQKAHNEARNSFWISYALTSITLYGYATKSNYEDRRAAAKVSFLIPFAMTFLKKWNLFTGSKNIEVLPQTILTPSNEMISGLVVKIEY